MRLKELNYVLHLGCLGVLVDVDVVCFFFICNLFLRKQNSTFEESLNGYWDGNCIQHIQASTKKILSFKYTLRHFHEVHQICEQFTFKTFNNECKKKKKLKIFLFHYREYLDLKQHVDQLRNKQKHLRSQRDVSNIQSL